MPPSSLPSFFSSLVHYSSPLRTKVAFSPPLPLSHHSTTTSPCVQAPSESSTNRLSLIHHALSVHPMSPSVCFFLLHSPLDNFSLSASLNFHNPNLLTNIFLTFLTDPVLSVRKVRNHQLGSVRKVRKMFEDPFAK